MNTIQTYALSSLSTIFSIDAETGLSSHDVVRHIYRYDGSDYRLEPKMLCNRTDEEGNELPDVQDTNSTGDLVFDIWFKSTGSFPWHNGQRIAIGKNEADAEAAFLQKSFDGRMWDNSYWVVVTTEQYLAAQAY